MKQKRFLLLYLFCFWFTFLGATQKLSRQEGLFINRSIDDFLSKTDYVYDKPRKSEFILILMEIDSIGYVNTVILLSDERNRDTTYELLKHLTPDIFKPRQFKDCIGKIIAVPVISIAPDFSSSYVMKMYKHPEYNIYRHLGYVLNFPFFYQIIESQYQKKENN